ncbi:hypothetical protein FEMY_20240 [Ferrovum myxofaciens]|uniref:Uncharacterized protein n=1 Tax=Ferrovum myxofaciens TaxID=416213 RepID=A0A149VW47_9PROT|nr:hypothetical protein [Ferrovum myxofaciens]KXW57461.1 hypothetical protein FEMY_20240 [Ferrovum myxofaciens]
MHTRISDEGTEGTEGNMHYFIDAGYIAIGNNFAKNCDSARALNHQDAIADLQKLAQAHTLLMGLIGGILENNDGRTVHNEDDTTKRRFVLTAAFVQGITLCEQSILQSLYLQAGNLLRQEFETLGLLSEVKKGIRKDGKVAHAQNAPWNSRKLYGELSSLAHMSDHKLLESIIGYQTSWGDFASTIPQYKKETATRLYGFHVSMVMGLVDELHSLYWDMFGYVIGERENEVLNVVYSILVKQGLFKAGYSA